MEGMRTGEIDTMVERNYNLVMKPDAEMSAESVRFVQSFVRDFGDRYSRPSCMERFYITAFNITEVSTRVKMDLLRHFVSAYNDHQITHRSKQA